MVLQRATNCGRVMNDRANTGRQTIQRDIVKSSKNLVHSIVLSTYYFLSPVLTFFCVEILFRNVRPYVSFISSFGITN